MSDKETILSRVCSAFSENNTVLSKRIIEQEYPFEPAMNVGRKYTPFQQTQTFIRDGFVDRYTGKGLVFPGTLRLISILMPDVFPFHPNWKMSECHIAYWELYPTIDHADPVARGGLDDESNWVCTSMLKNAAKANSTLEELGWTLFPPGKIADWDGLMSWFLDYVGSNQVHLQNSFIKTWYNAAFRSKHTNRY